MKSLKKRVSALSPEKLARVAKMLVECAAASDIERGLSVEWNVTERTIRNYIAAVRKKWAENGTTASREERSYSRERNKAALEAVVHANLKKGDPAAHAVAVRAIRELNLMDGHHYKRVEISGPKGGPIALALTSPEMDRKIAGMSDEQLDLVESVAEQLLLAAPEVVGEATNVHPEGVE